MSHQLFIDFYLYNFAEIALVLYLLAYILYAVVFGGSSTFSHPTLLKSTIVFTKILLLCILLAFGNTGSDYIFNGGSNSNIFSFVFRIILLLSSIALLCISRDYLSSRMIVKYEYDLLILFSIISLIILSNSDDFLIVYLAIELQSLAFYALATFQRHSEFSTETGLKYFILGALSSGLLLFGFALIYVAFGVTSFEALSKLFSTSDGVLAFWGLLFILAAFLFKLGAAPFHMWLCDVYEGSLTTVTAFFAAVPKIILWGLLLRLCSTIFYGCTEYLSILLVIAGLISVCFASVAALYQKRVKRLLAYSTISHTGFILLGISCGSIDSIKSCFIYIALYSLMSLLTFSIIIYTSLNNKIPKYLINWTAVSQRNFCLAISFSLILFSIAGIPPLAGFYSKMCILLSLVGQNQVFAAVILVVFSSIACFYYIRLIKIFFFSNNSSNNIWSGCGARNIELFLGIGIPTIVIFCARTKLLTTISVIVALSLF